MRQFLRIAAAAVAAAAALSTSGAALRAQSPDRTLSADQSMAALQRTLDGLTSTARVLVVGMHPDDEPSELITWLSRGHHIETAYLSITRGEAGKGFGGNETGTMLGAIRTQEALAARRIDGAQQFYTRAYDVGPTRSTNETFKLWSRDSVVGDVVAVIRSFRPQVIVAMLVDSTAGVDGQHLALTTLVDQAFTSSADLKRFPSDEFGVAWPVAKMYRPGAGLRLELDGYDAMLGTPLSEIALQARAQQRSQGLQALAVTWKDEIELQRIASRVGDDASVDASLFAGIDTSFARLMTMNSDVTNVLKEFRASIDSAHAAFDPVRPELIVPQLARAATAASTLRGEVPFCKHPLASASPPPTGNAGCVAAWADLDAAVDHFREGAASALLAAARVSFEATSDRELVAGIDTASVMIAIHNRGTQAATIADLSIWGSAPSPFNVITVAPDSTTRILRRVANLAESAEWWIGLRGGVKRGGERFAGVISAVDGLSRSELIVGPMRVLGVAVPENIRRNSDATISVTVAGATVTTSVGPFIYRYSDPVVGLQQRAVGGIADVTLQFVHGLDWIVRNKPTDRALHIAVKSHADRPIDVDLRVAAPQGFPKGLRIDSLSPRLHLDAHEERDFPLLLRGKLVDTSRTAVALIGSATKPGVDTTKKLTVGEKAIYQTGLRTIQRTYLPPVRLMPSSGQWIQPVDLEIPPALTTLYISGVSDDIYLALKQVGVWATDLSSPDQLLTVDLSKISTVAIGPFALEAHPELLNQTGRLHEFVRKGGTLVVLRGDNPTVSAPIFPLPIALSRTYPVRVAQPDAPVVPVDRTSRVLNWPNKLGEADWADWIGPRSLATPTTADPRYIRVIETHDPGDDENNNSILINKIGKGTIVYTSLTLEQQIAGGVPGALRLLVNLLSAGLPPGTPGAAK